MSQNHEQDRTPEQPPELAEQDLDAVSGGILSSGHGTRNLGTGKDGGIRRPDVKKMEWVHEDE